MAHQFSLSREGYITSYLVAPPALEDFIAPYGLSDSLEFERQMRSLFYREPPANAFGGKLGETSSIGTAWQFYARNRDPYVDFPKFYFCLTRVTFLAKTVVVSDRDREAKVRVWSYAAFDLYLNGERLVTEKVPVYQPIRFTDVTLPLRRGENELCFYIQNMGIRDTRNMLSVQFRDAEGITTTLPVEADTLRALAEAEEWFCGLRICDDVLTAPGKAPFDARVTVDERPAEAFSGGDMPLNKGFSVKVSATISGQEFNRVFENYANIRLSYEKHKTDNAFLENAEAFCRGLVTGVDEIGNIYGGVSPNNRANAALSRLVADPEHRLIPSDIRAIREALPSVYRREDCSDFVVLALLRLMMEFALPEDLREELKDVLLQFRYWMDENGEDAMCFWSENHAITFFVCQALAGRMFPENVFVRSGRTGNQQEKLGMDRIGQWFDVVGKEGFEEYLAGGYLGVTALAVLAIYDYFGEPYRTKAKLVLDRILRDAATQCFRGVHMAPMGRIYRTSLIPFQSHLQSMLHILDESCVSFPGNFAPFALSDYKVPEDIRERIHGDADAVSTSGRAQIHTKKTKHYMLTSVASPRAQKPEPVENPDTEYYRTLLMNEGFHGTTLFEPGKFGYQQHMMYAAISERFYTFITLPGSEKDFTNMRPGYWYGNLVFPALKQEGKELWCRYRIPDCVPTKFTHAYYPAYAADETAEKGGFRFARVGEGYLALWCSQALEMNNADAVVDGDLRAYAEDVCWYIRVGSSEEDGSFEEFMETCLKSGISPEKVQEKLNV